MAKVFTARARTSVFHSHRWTRRLQSLGFFLLLLFLAVIVIGIPVGWTLATALKERFEVIAWPPVYWPKNPRWENFSEVIIRADLVRFSINSLFIAIITIIGRVLSCSIVAFSFARMRFPGRNVLFLLLLSTLMIPHQITLIPQFVLFQSLGWVGTYLPLLVPTFFGAPFFIFLMRQYIGSAIPRELVEAARIDGCSEFGIYRRIIVPLCGPALATLGLVTFIASWNNFLGPLIIFRSTETYPAALALRSLQGLANTDWGALLVGVVLTVVPLLIVFVFASRQLIAGLTAGATKG